MDVKKQEQKSTQPKWNPIKRLMSQTKVVDKYVYMTKEELVVECEKVLEELKEAEHA
ncbi:MAG: hypothetical protein FWE38_04100 [Firmicutes bacterium]|nr:hypothetical protein [Bacillota bacterium]